MNTLCWYLSSALRNFKEVRELKVYLNKKEKFDKENEKEVERQRHSDLRTVRKIFKKHKMIANLMSIRSRRLRYLLIDIIVEPSLFRKRYEHMEQELRDHENKYSAIREYLGVRPNKPLHVKYVKLYKMQVMAYKYREVFEKALDIVNYPSDEHSQL